METAVADPRTDGDAEQSDTRRNGDGGRNPKRKEAVMRQIESRIQQNCVAWFNLYYRDLKGLLFSVPNGGSRNVREAEKLKKEGVVAGVSDLILLVPNRQYTALCIEMKSENGRQSERQKQWQMLVEKKGGAKYVVCHSETEFSIEVDNYLRDAKKEEF